MVEDRVDRRLAAILAGDIAGYSRLMGVDEEGTLRQLKAHRKELVDPKITEHRGRIVKTTGDGMLVEFASVVDAVRCAVEIQRGMAERNAERAGGQAHRVPHRHQCRRHHHRRQRYLRRRRQRRGAAGGARRARRHLVSRNVHEQVRDKLSFGFEDMGEQTVKNIARPIGVHRVSLAERPHRSRQAAAAAPKSELCEFRAALDRRPAVRQHERRPRAGIFRRRHFRRHHHRAVEAALVLRHRAQFVLHLQGQGGRREARRARTRRALRPRGQRAQGRQPRAHHRPADRRRDRRPSLGRALRSRPDRIFAVQDEITKKVVAAIEPKLLEAEGVRSQGRSPEDLDAWDTVMQTNSLLWRLTKD